VSIEGNTIKCDVCGREYRIAGTSSGLPDTTKHTYEKPGIPEAERTYLSGVTAQAAARKLGWKSVGENDYCADCA
jgi:hypothetical protein